MLLSSNFLSDCSYVNPDPVEEKNPAFDAQFLNLFLSVRLMIACHQASNLTGIYRTACRLKCKCLEIHMQSITGPEKNDMPELSPLKPDL